LSLDTASWNSASLVGAAAQTCGPSSHQRAVEPGDDDDDPAASADRRVSLAGRRWQMAGPRPPRSKEAGRGGGGRQAPAVTLPSVLLHRHDAPPLPLTVRGTTAMMARGGEGEERARAVPWLASHGLKRANDKGEWEKRSESARPVHLHFFFVTRTHARASHTLPRPCHKLLSTPSPLRPCLVFAIAGHPKREKQPRRRALGRIDSPPPPPFALSSF
jgi:hypothetical protein